MALGGQTRNRSASAINCVSPAAETRRGEQWFVKHIGTSNYIMVDGEKQSSDDDIALHDGSVLGLPLCQFMVRIGSVSGSAE